MSLLPFKVVLDLDILFRKFPLCWIKELHRSGCRKRHAVAIVTINFILVGIYWAVMVVGCSIEIAVIFVCRGFSQGSTRR